MRFKGFEDLHVNTEDYRYETYLWHGAPAWFPVGATLQIGRNLRKRSKCLRLDHVKFHMRLVFVVVANLSFSKDHRTTGCYISLSVDDGRVLVMHSRSCESLPGVNEWDCLREVGLQSTPRCTSSILVFNPVDKTYEGGQSRG